MTYIESRTRSVVKTLSWRILATLTTMGLVYLFIGNVVVALEVGSLEVLAKLILFFVHERAWNMISWGKIAVKESDVHGERAP